MFPLLSLRLLVLLAACAVGFVVLAVVVGRRRRGRSRLLAAAGPVLLSLALVVGAVGVGVNRHFVLYRSWGSLFGLHSRDLVVTHTPEALARALAPLPVGAPVRTHGQLLSLQIPGTASGLKAATSLVYLPPQYGTPAWAGRGFPVVEAIPGSPGAPGDYINGIAADTQLDGAINHHLLPPVIVVFPPSNLSVLRSLECVNTADGLNDETYLTEDVRAWVNSHLDASPQRWTVMGYSSGGYCALDLAYRHPDLYARAVSLDGYAHALNDHYARGLWPHGYAGVMARLEHSPDWWIAHHQPEPVDVYLSAGTHDHDAAVDAVRLWDLLRTTGWRSPADRLVVEPGAHHTFAAWSRAFLPALRWALSSEAPASAGGDAQALAQLTSAARTRCGTGAAPPTPPSGPAPAASPSACRPRPSTGPTATPAASPSRRPTVAPPRPLPSTSPTRRPSPTASPRPSPSPAPSRTASSSPSP